MLVLDTEKTKEFFETLDVLGPAHSSVVIRYVGEILKHTELLEIRIKKLEREKRELEAQMRLKEAFEGEIEKQAEQLACVEPGIPSEKETDSETIFGKYYGDNEPAF